MSNPPTLVFVPGAWHKPTCYDKVIKILRSEHSIKCVAITLPSTTGNPNATFKDDIDTARNAITSETSQGRDVIVIAHSYGGMVGNSATKGLTAPQAPTDSQSHRSSSSTGYVKALVLIASGFTMTGVAFMDPACGLPSPFWRINKEAGIVELVPDPRYFFYHDVADEEAAYWVSQLTTHSVKSLYEGSEHAYAGWQDVPTWYIGTAEDRGLPAVMQRVQVGAVRALGAVVHHTELQSSHSPFLSMPQEVVDVLLEAVAVVTATEVPVKAAGKLTTRVGVTPSFQLTAPGTWFKFGLPLFIGHVLGWGAAGFLGLRRLWRRK